MKTLPIRFQWWAVVLMIGLAVTGHPLHGQAMSLFMGGEEPKTVPPPPKPVATKPLNTAGQPGAKQAQTAVTTQPPTPGSTAQPAPPSPVAAGTSPLSPVAPGGPAAPSVGVNAPKLGVAQSPIQATAPAQTASPAPSAQATGAPAVGAAQPAAPAGQIAGAPKELPKPAVSAPAQSIPASPTASPAKVADLVGTAVGYTYDPKGRRDPFQSLTRLARGGKTGAEMPPLQRVQISDLKLLGIMWGGYGYYALVQTPDGKGYTVKEGMLMGTNNGVITTITDRAIIVSEPSIDIEGQKSTKSVELLLRPKEVS